MKMIRERRAGQHSVLPRKVSAKLRHLSHKPPTGRVSACFVRRLGANLTFTIRIVAARSEQLSVSRSSPKARLPATQFAIKPAEQGQNDRHVTQDRYIRP